MVLAAVLTLSSSFASAIGSSTEPVDVQRALVRGLLLVALSLYTAFGRRSLRLDRHHVGAHHLRDRRNPYGWPETWHLDKYVQAWTGSNYDLYFWNSTVVVVTSVVLLTLIGTMAAHCLARYRFRGNRLIYFIIFSTIIFPPQITIIALFQVLAD